MENEELDTRTRLTNFVTKLKKKFMDYNGPLIIFLGIIATGFILKYYDKNTEKKLALRGVKTVGMVYKYNYRKGYWVFTHFKLNGKDYSTSEFVGKDIEGIFIGAQYEVTYLPESPRKCRVNFSKRIPFKSKKEYQKAQRLLDSLERVKFSNWKSSD